MAESAPVLTRTLQQYFGHASFRPGQRRLVEAVLDGRDLLAVMPTGAGKSLGFQLPAVRLPGLTLVVSPLVALMKDQVGELQRRGIAAAALSAQTAGDERRRVWRAGLAGDLRLLYVAPERFRSDTFAGWLEQVPVARFVVDEAHCVSQWAHGFRPDYGRLQAAALDCRRGDGRPGRPPLVAVTATATPEVRADIIDLLGLAEPEVIVAGFDRPNIRLVVIPASSEGDKHARLPCLTGAGRSLVYAATRRRAEAAARTLRAAGVAAAAYHAGLPGEERVRVQDAFGAGTLPVVCATNAFGMGIDCPDIEAVVHVDLPGSLEAYYQEIGRAGRDGRSAVATLLWQHADVRTRQRLIERGGAPGPGQAGRVADPATLARRTAVEHGHLRRMVAYAESAGCLRAAILRYFGDSTARESCGACGVCDRRASLNPATRLFLRKILSGVARAGERYGRRRIAAMLAGDLEGLPEPLRRLSTTGLLRDEHPRTIERWLDAACAAGLLDLSPDRYRTLRLTPRGRDVMAGRIDDVTVAVPPGDRRGAARRGGRRKRLRTGPAR